MNYKLQRYFVTCDLTRFMFAVMIMAAFFACSDMKAGEAEVVEMELPSDFNKVEYSEINPDVSKSQILFDIESKTQGSKLTTAQKKADCAEFLSDENYAGEIYMNFLGCPKQGWDPNDKCAGEYAGNPSYTRYTINKDGDTTKVECKIAGCWSGGWDEPMEDCGGCEPFSLKHELPTMLAAYLKNDYAASGPTKSVEAICKFNLLQDGAPSLAADKNYLNSFAFDTLLIERHYSMIGRYEGRPYKYCEAGKIDKVRSVDMAVVYTQGQGYTFFDYSANLFCMNKDDEKIYRIKEN